ncbi:MAG TPA: protein kinase, partial [Kofleriaceae bacterium]|nr:protein kinase [Kofleriaceae bacterium]
MARRGTEDDRQTVQLGVRPRPPDPEEFAEDPKTVLDEARALEEAAADPAVRRPDTAAERPHHGEPERRPGIGEAAPVSQLGAVSAPMTAPETVPVRSPEPASELAPETPAEATPPTVTDGVPEATDPDRDRSDAVPLVDPVHQLPTQQLGAPRRAQSSVSKTPPPGASTTSSPVDAMKFDEVARTRIFAKVALAITLGGIIAALGTGGDPVAKIVLLVGSSAAGLGTLIVLALTRDPARYDPRQLVLPGLAILSGAMSGVYYWGTGSPVAAMLVYGIYFFSLGAHGRIVNSLYALIAGIHGVLGLGILSGVLADHGVVRIDQLRTREQIAILCIIEALYFFAYYTARVSQRVTLDAMGKLEQAVRGNAQRDALLAEARAELDRALKIGGPGRFTEQVIGSFRLGILIGRGGMGEVYEAHAVTDQREAAVKLLHPGTLAEPIQLQRFLREAQTASRIDCPHVVRVLEVGTTAGELPFLAMERLRGHDLAHQLRRQRRLPLLDTKVLVDQVAVGLEAARVAGIVHRDLKPHNVFLAEEGGLRRWKILDFGVSKAGGSGTLTQGHVVGTPAYMAPEQARGEDVDHRADVYSLAAIIYRSVTGHPAFSGKDVPTTLYDVVYRVPTQPSLLAPVPGDVDRVLALGLAK